MCIKTILPFAAIAILFLSPGCFSSKHEVKVEPIEVKPMEVTININLKIDQELKKEFGKEDNLVKEISDEEAEAALMKYMEKKKSEKEDQ